MQRRRFERGRLRDIGQMREQVLRVEVQQSRVVANETATERAARQLAEALILQCLDLTRRQLQLLRNLVERKPGSFARCPQARAGASRCGDMRDRCVRAGVDWRLLLLCRPSQASVLIALVSIEFG